LIVKGVAVTANHRLSELLVDVLKLYNESTVIEFYSKYIEQERLPDILSEFCNESGMTMDLYFQSLKYPTSTKDTEFNHTVLRYNGNEGCELFSSIKKDIEDFHNVFMDFFYNTAYLNNIFPICFKRYGYLSNWMVVSDI
jgi:hypothetical protein